MLHNRQPQTFYQKLPLWSPECRDTKWFRQELIGGYKKWVGDYVNKNWQPYFISFMFHQLPGTRSSALRRMNAEVVRVYRRLPTQFSRNPRSPAGAKLIPRMILFPDLPVYKHKKKFIEDVSSTMAFIMGALPLLPQFRAFNRAWTVSLLKMNSIASAKSWRELTSRRSPPILVSLSIMPQNPSSAV